MRRRPAAAPAARHHARALRSPAALWVAAIAGAIALAPIALADFSDISVPGTKDGPTVTFVAIGSPPRACTSQPDRSAITIYRNAWLNFVNRTGVEATLWVDETQFPLADGKGRAFKLRTADAYTVSLVPDCPVAAGDVTSLLVRVEAGVDPTTGPSTGRGGSSRSTRPAAPDRSSPQPGQSGVGQTVPVGSQSGTTTPGFAGGPSRAPGDKDDEGSGRFVGGRDGQGLRLLAIIAAVCVFGVSLAIIRVILAQRAIKTVEA